MGYWINPQRPCERAVILEEVLMVVRSVSQKISSDAIRQIFNRAWRVQNIRTAKLLTENHKRYSFKATHSFRKYFETKCLKKMKLLNVKLLIGQDTGLEKSYYKPSESELLEDYLQVVNDLDFKSRVQTKNENNRAWNLNKMT